MEVQCSCHSVLVFARHVLPFDNEKLCVWVQFFLTPVVSVCLHAQVNASCASNSSGPSHQFRPGCG